MAVVTIDGIKLELPDDATPVRLLERVLRRAWLERRAALGLPGTPEEADESTPEEAEALRPELLLWPEMLFHLWGQDLIALVARHGEPDAPPRPIDFPQAERVWSRFNVRSLMPYGELLHTPTGRRFFDLHARPTTPAAQPQRRTTAPPALDTTDRKAVRAAIQDAVRQIAADGKVPATPGYTVDQFETDVRRLSGIGEAKAPGLSPRNLGRVYDKELEELEKSKAPKRRS